MAFLSLGQNLVPLGWREMLKLQRLLGNKRHRQVEVVIPQLEKEKGRYRERYLCYNEHGKSTHIQ